jgi:hypothetical protein
VAWVGGPIGGSTGAAQVHVKRWTGTAWQLVGGPLNADPDSVAHEPKIETIGGVPHVAWYESDDGNGTARVSVARWNAGTSAWVAVGGNVLGAGDVLQEDYLDLAEVGGEPHVTWAQKTGGMFPVEVVVKRFTAGAWQELPSPNTTVSPLNNFLFPDIESIDGVLHVALVDLSDGVGFPILIAEFTGGSWSVVGDYLSGTAEHARPRLAELDGEPAVVWYDVSNGMTFGDTSLRMSRWNGTTWADVGPPIHDDAPGAAILPALEVVHDVPYVAWIGTADTPLIQVAHLEGSAWEPDGEPTAQPGGTFGLVSPALASVGDIPHLTWTDYDGTSRIHAGRIADQSVIQLSAATYAADESDGSVAIAVERQGSTAGTASVEVETTDGTATGGVDYDGGSGTVNFANGQASQGLVITINDDEAPEADETVNIALSDPEGATLGSPASATLTIDDDDPIDTQITSGPIGPTNDLTPTFNFTANPAAGASFECSLNNSAFSSCLTPFTTSTLPDGPYTLRVWAKNATPAVDSTPASRAFFVDTVAPTTTLGVSAQPGQGADLGDGRFSGTVLISRQLNDPAPSPGGGGVQCVVDPPTRPATIDQIPTSGCPLVVTAPGQHRVYAASFDAAGNKGPVVQASFEIVAPPETTIISGPEGTSWTSTPTFTFASSQPSSTFRCRVDGTPVECSSPFTIQTPLGPGTHNFQVAAESPAGVEDPTPASRLFEVGARETHSATCVVSPWIMRPFPGAAQQWTNSCWVLPRAAGCPDEDGESQCGYVNEPCPVGAECTGTTQTTFSERDSVQVVWMVQSSVKFGPLSEAHDMRLGDVRNRGFAAFCDPDPGPTCSTSATRTWIGNGDYMSATCGAVNVSDPIELFGPAETRFQTCQVSLTIKPAVALQATASGTSGSAYVPVAGTLTVGSAGSGAPTGKVTMAKESENPAFRTIKAEAKVAGPVSFKFKLSKPAAKTYKRKGKVRLSLRASFKPKGGGRTLKRKQKLTLVAPPELAPTPLP